jgi:hypothetical protein
MPTEIVAEIGGMMSNPLSSAIHAPTQQAELQGSIPKIERQIVLGTWGRIHNLRVESIGNGLRVVAQTPSHYIKQLVLHAVYEVLGTETKVPVEFDIQVGKATRHMLPGNNDLWGVPSRPA